MAFGSFFSAVRLYDRRCRTTTKKTEEENRREEEERGRNERDRKRERKEEEEEEEKESVYAIAHLSTIDTFTHTDMQSRSKETILTE